MAECCSVIILHLSVWRQCALLGLARSGIYRQPAPPEPEELALMRWLDGQYLATPFYPMARGLLYLVVVMDWYSRCVLAWRLSNTRDTALPCGARRHAGQR